MKYIVLVSHGTFAPGLHNALLMLAGEDRKDILSTSLENGMGSDTYVENVRKCIAQVTQEDEVLLLGDLVGGSPLTLAANVIAERGLLPKTVMIGGVNMPLALSAALMKDDMELGDLAEALLAESRDVMQEFKISEDETEEDL